MIRKLNGARNCVGKDEQPRPDEKTKPPDDDKYLFGDGESVGTKNKNKTEAKSTTVKAKARRDGRNPATKNDNTEREGKKEKR